MLVNEAIETLRYEIDEECHCDYIAEEIRCLISAYENLIAQEEKAHQYCKNKCEPNYKTQIQSLQAELNQYAEEHHELITEKYKLKKENERLKVYTNTLLMSLELCTGWDKRAKTEAYKEFAKRLKEEFHECRKQYKEVMNFDGACAMLIAKEVTNNILKVMVGEDK